MWLHWFHRGALTGDAIVSDMLFVSVERFREATERWLDFRMSLWGWDFLTQVIRQTLILKDVRLYARLYALRALRAGHPDVTRHA